MVKHTITFILAIGMVFAPFIGLVSGVYFLDGIIGAGMGTACGILLSLTFIIFFGDRFMRF